MKFIFDIFNAQRQELMYTKLGRAVETLRKRNSNSLENYLEKTSLPKNLYSYFNEPRAIIFRQLSTPTHEILHAVKTAESAGLKPIIFEYLDDKFVPNGNKYKRGLGKLPVFIRKDRNNDSVYKYRTVLNYETEVGKTLREAKTLTGQSLVDLHHELFEKITPNSKKIDFIECSSWFKKVGGTPIQYYSDIMKLLIKDSILLEVLSVNASERKFVDRVIKPVFYATQREFKLRPLIVRSVNRREEKDFFWDCYPQEVNEYLDTKGYS